MCVHVHLFFVILSLEQWMLQGRKNGCKVVIEGDEGQRVKNHWTRLWQYKCCFLSLDLGQSDFFLLLIKYYAQNFLCGAYYMRTVIYNIVQGRDSQLRKQAP